MTLMASANAMRPLLGILRPHRKLLLAAVLCTLLTATVALAVPWFGRAMLDRVIASRDAQDVNRGFLLIGLLWISSVGLGLARNLLTLNLGQRVIRDVRQRFIAHVLCLPVAFFDESRSGDLVARLSNDTDQLRRTLTEDMVGSVGQIAILVGGAAVLLALDWRFTACLLVLSPLVYVGHRWLAPRLRIYNRASLGAFSSVVGRVSEAIANLRLLKALGREHHEARVASGALEKVLDSSLRAGRFETTAWTGVYGAFGVIALAAIWYGVRRVVSGDLSIGTMLAYLYTMMLVAGPLASLAGVVARAQRASAAAERIFEILDLPGEDLTSAGAADLHASRGAVAFKDMNFSFGPGRPVLDGFSLELPAGRTTALVGATGAGKSTVVALLLRFYEPAGGEIFIDGVPIKHVSRASVRASIALVPQETMLFDDSIRENIRYGRLDATDAEIDAAAVAAHVDEFTRGLLHGLDTEIGERGVRLSGGQRQRIAIARAVLRSAPILVLDEATSSLDAHSESLVQEALGRLRTGRTTLVVAHRLGTVKDADQIAVLEGGRIVATGTHPELLVRSPEYRRLQAFLA